MPPAILTFAAITVMLIWVVVFWLALRALFIKFSGWDRLEARFRVAWPPREWDWRDQTVKIGLVRYRRTVNLAVRPEGLYLAQSSLEVRPALCIPWNEMVSAKRSWFYGRPSIGVSIGMPAFGVLEFYEPLYEEIRARAASSVV